MPCQRGMRGCRRDCLHRRMVMEYRLARHNELLEEETVTHGYRTEIYERRRYVKRPITFKEWLTGEMK